MPNMDLQRQKPFTTSQITQKKPNVPNSFTPLSGYVAGSQNGGHNKVHAWKQIMAGEQHAGYRLRECIQLLTPKTPTYQNLKATVRTYFVPNIRVWKNAEKYTAQRGGSSETKIEKIPNYGGKTIPWIEDNNGDETYTSYMNTALWRDTFISAYIPRIGQFVTDEGQTQQIAARVNTLPAGSILPLRGRIAIYNDLERNKEYDDLYQEYNGDEVTEQEWNSYLMREVDLQDNPTKWNVLSGRAKRENNYYTDYRTEIQGFEAEEPNMSADQALVNWATFESLIAETRAQAENAQKTDWEIISEIRGSRKLTEGKVQLIGKKTFNLNYSAVTQNAYNTNDTIEEPFQVLGKQGAYSYTEIDISCYEGIEFVEEGYIHIIVTVSADSVFESGFDRLELNITPLDQYRPDLVGKKQDVLYSIEKSSLLGTSQESIQGFKRAYSEYFKLPNIIQGDLTSKDYYGYGNNQDWFQVKWNNRIITQKTFQFFEEADDLYRSDAYGYAHKNIWQDYTDILINKNQAILNPIYNYPQSRDGKCGITIDGQNQIFFVGLATCYANLPIDPSIKDNYSKWGEH